MDLPLLDAKNLSVTYVNGEIALKEVDLRIDSGESVLVVGATGSGKSTLAQRLLNVIPHQVKAKATGEVLLRGESTEGVTPHRIAKEIQLVLQNPEAMLFALNVEQNVYFGLENLCLSKEEIFEKTDQALTLMRISSLRKRSPLELSGGEMQAAALASVMATDPSLFILDEPLTYLDKKGKQNLIEHLDQLKKMGRALLILEHRIDLAREIVDRVVVLRQGKKILDEPIDSVSDADLKNSMGLRTDSVFSFSSFEFPNKMIESEETLLKCSNVTFTYNEEENKLTPPTLNNVSMQIESGEFVALIGDNGCGKSTLATCLVGLDRLQDGVIKLFGKSIYDLSPSERASQIGLMFQRPETQLFCRTVKEELYFGGRNIHIPKEELEVRVYEEADALGLTPLLKRHPATLSRGEMRRLALACHLIMRPSLLILDEPTIGQDYAHLELIGRRLKVFNSLGCSLILITHDHGFAKSLATRVIEMEKGEITNDARIEHFSHL